MHLGLERVERVLRVSGRYRGGMLTAMAEAEAEAEAELDTGDGGVSIAVADLHSLLDSNKRGKHGRYAFFTVFLYVCICILFLTINHSTGHLSRIQHPTLSLSLSVSLSLP